MKKRLLTFLMVATVLMVGCGQTTENSAYTENTTASEMSETNSSETVEISTSDESSVSNAAAESNNESDVNESEYSDSVNVSESSDNSESVNDNDIQSDVEKDNTTSVSQDSDDTKESATEKNSEITIKEKSEEKASSDVKNETSADKESGDTDNKSKDDQKKSETDSKDTKNVKENTKIDYGRIMFAGDSRSVDMFNGGTNELWDEEHDGIRVFCKDACQSDYMVTAASCLGYDNFDTLISWMGCNDYGNFAPYEAYYNSLLQQGKKLIVCTVGPTEDSYLSNDFDRTNYNNDRQKNFNNALINWANNNGVKVIDLYSYIVSHDSIYIDPADGIHYQPQPTTELWNVILNSIR
ncbi:SGNH/GDSL hydrolase family protein [Butyrivibrio sp. YAB3001]|uniref:SGNH/GDSL hydrolase family protein n=1 Tax=Butyrivibrio sp. YAB3001 TaxID=1520812 RepID=UPI0008F6269C|nr:SGNH/GDSL hydrolase family protein [Butyrivibrio sp. YAB3001]SFB83541.1 hypothetical protein SAMN02910398_00805 [Butyrivibrio sp. YAB3001]